MGPMSYFVSKAFSVACRYRDLLWWSMVDPLLLKFSEGIRRVSMLRRSLSIELVSNFGTALESPREDLGAVWGRTL